MAKQILGMTKFKIRAITGTEKEVNAAPICFGTKEFSKVNSICNACKKYKECYDVRIKKGAM